MIGKTLLQEDFKSRKQYLVALAIEYIREHTGYVGVDDDGGYALANDLAYEFKLDDLAEKNLLFMTPANTKER